MEKRLSIKFQKIIGDSIFPPGVFSGTAIFEREDETTRAHRGKLFTLLSIIGPKNFDAVLSSKMILDCLEEEYFREIEGSPLGALERAAVSASHRFIDLTLGESAVSGSAEFNLVLAVSWGQVLYLCKIGSAAVYLLRGGIVKEITMGDETQVSTASGLVVEGDVLILGTRSFKEVFPSEKILSLLPNIEEEIAKLNNRSVISAFILKFDIAESPSRDEVIKFAEEKSVSRRLLPSVLDPLRKIVASLSGKIKMVFLHRRPYELFLRSRPSLQKTPSRVGLKMLIIVLLAVFAFSVAMTVKRQNQQKLSAQSQKLFSQAQENIVSAADLTNLNNSRAKTLIEEALKDLDRIEKYGYKSEELSKLRVKAQGLLSTVTKDKLVSAKLLYDFSLQNKKAALSSMTLTPFGEGLERKLFISDRPSSAVYEVTLKADGVSIEKIDKGKVSDPQFLTFYSDNLTGLDKNGLFNINLKDSVATTDLLAGTDLNPVVDLKSYLGNIYFLSPKNGGLLKSFVLEDGKYSKPVRWLKEDRDLSKATSFAVDGSIYVFESTGRIIKFEAGKVAEFSVSGFDEVFSSASVIYTDSQSTFIYIFDPKSGKIISLSKDGVYQGRYTIEEGLREKPIFAVDEEAKKAYFLSDSKLLRIDLE